MREECEARVRRVREGCSWPIARYQKVSMLADRSTYDSTHLDLGSLLDKLGFVLGGLKTEAMQANVHSAAGEEVVDVEGLGEVVRSSCVERHDAILERSAGGEEDAGDLSEARVLADPLDERQAVDSGHHDVRENLWSKGRGGRKL